jgi:iron complex transport system substrate-binding protein
MRRPYLLVPLLCLLAWTAAAQPPQRIVSMNLCTDQLLLLLVERERIASLSYFAADPLYSIYADQALGIPGNRGQAEEVLGFSPDLVLTSLFSATLAASLLERLGHRVERLGFANSLEEVYAQIRQVAALTGTQQRAAALIAETDRRIAQHTPQLAPLAGKSAAFYSANGISYGSATLQHDFLTRLGLRNVAADAGLQGPALLPLELLLANAPDYIFTDPRTLLDSQLAQPLLQHPALQALAEHTRFLVVSERHFQCAGPQVADAWRELARQFPEIVAVAAEPGTDEPVDDEQ